MFLRHSRRIYVSTTKRSIVLLVIQLLLSINHFNALAFSDAFSFSPKKKNLHVSSIPKPIHRYSTHHYPRRLAPKQSFSLYDHSPSSSSSSSGEETSSLNHHQQPKIQTKKISFWKRIFGKSTPKEEYLKQKENDATANQTVVSSVPSNETLQETNSTEVNLPISNIIAAKDDNNSTDPLIQTKKLHQEQEETEKESPITFEDYADSLFQKFDKDKSGFIDKEEFRDVAKKISISDKDGGNTILDALSVGQNEGKEEELSQGKEDEIMLHNKTQISKVTVNHEKLSTSDSSSFKKKVKSLLRFVTLAVMVTVIAPFMKLAEDEYGDIVGVSFKPPTQIGNVPLRYPSMLIDDEPDDIRSDTEDRDVDLPPSMNGEDESSSLEDVEEQRDLPPLPNNSVPKKGVISLPPTSALLSESSESSSQASHKVYRTSAMGYVAEAVEKVGPAVIRIDTETDIERSVQVGKRLDSSKESVDGESPEEDLDSIPDRMKFIQQGQGSGFIFCKEGLVLTNAHVVQGASRVTVTLTDGRRFRAEVKGADEIVDIAVLKILDENGHKAFGNGGSTKSPLPVAEFGDSDNIQVGQFVIAVGSK